MNNTNPQKWIELKEKVITEIIKAKQEKKYVKLEFLQRCAKQIDNQIAIAEFNQVIWKKRD